jgi:hypothetical protein
MRGNLGYVLSALVIATATAVLRIHTMPKRLMAERTAVYLKQAQGHNKFVHQKLADASWREFVSPSPDLLYSYLVFDTSRSAVAVEMPSYDDFWINQMVDDQTDTFGFVGHQTPGSQIRFVVYSDATPTFVTPQNFASFKSPSPTGLFLLRYLVRDPASIPRIDDTRHKIRVWELRHETGTN